MNRVGSLPQFFIGTTPYLDDFEAVLQNLNRFWRQE